MKPDASHGKAIPIRCPLQQLFSYIGIGTGGGAPGACAPPLSSFHKLLTTLCSFKLCPPIKKPFLRNRVSYEVTFTVHWIVLYYIKRACLNPDRTDRKCTGSSCYCMHSTVIGELGFSV